MKDTQPRSPKELLRNWKKVLSIKRRDLREDNQKYHKEFSLIPEFRWPENLMDNISKVFRSKDYLVQQFDEDNGIIRLSICKTELKKDGKWEDGMTWDELYDIKNQLGFEDREAVEIYPRKSNIVNVANFRHLWLLVEPMEFSWKNKQINK